MDTSTPKVSPKPLSPRDLLKLMNKNRAREIASRYEEEI